MAYNNIAVAYLNLGDLDKALASVERSLALEPGYAEAHNNQCEISGNGRQRQGPCRR